MLVFRKVRNVVKEKPKKRQVKKPTSGSLFDLLLMMSDVTDHSTMA